MVHCRLDRYKDISALDVLVNFVLIFPYPCFIQTAKENLLFFLDVVSKLQMLAH